jgi:hypothetical protein
MSLVGCKCEKPSLSKKYKESTSEIPYINLINNIKKSNREVKVNKYSPKDYSNLIKKTNGLFTKEVSILLKSYLGVNIPRNKLHNISKNFLEVYNKKSFEKIMGTIKDTLGINIEIKGSPEMFNNFMKTKNIMNYIQKSRTGEVTFNFAKVLKLGDKLQKYVEKTKNVRINIKSGKSSLSNMASTFLNGANMTKVKSLLNSSKSLKGVNMTKAKSLFNMAKGYLGKS